MKTGGRSDHSGNSRNRALVATTRLGAFSTPRPSAAWFVLYQRREGGKHAPECFEKGILLFGYHELPVELSQSGDWDAVMRKLLTLRKGKKGAAANDLRQVRNYYEADETVLWITIHDNHLWWCFSEPVARLFHAEDNGDARDRYVYR